MKFVPLVFLFAGCNFDSIQQKELAINFERERIPQGCHLPQGSYVILREAETTCKVFPLVLPYRWSNKEYLPCYAIFFKDGDLWITLNNSFYMSRHEINDSCKTYIHSYGKFER